MFMSIPASVRSSFIEILAPMRSTISLILAPVRSSFIVTVAAGLTCVLGAIRAEDAAILGFSADHAGRQIELEAAFDAKLDADNLRRWMREMTVRPHHAGSPQAKKNAEFIAKLFRSWGYETEIEVFHVLFPTPRTRELEMLAPVSFKASLTEEVSSKDSAASALVKEGLPPYNAYSADGEVTAELVYVNRGLPQDYEVLRRHGIDVEGKIVIARYYGSWRGIKPKVAAEKGAIGCIIYNDPIDDGYHHGSGYPKGAFKHETAVQRGSVIDLPTRPGDPQTPGHGGTENAKRLSVAESETIMKIPVLPISSSDARPFLEALGGPVAPELWRGALPITYRMGPGPSKVRLKLSFNWDVIPSYNVIGKMRGERRPEQWVVRGNHHDAWGIGARDPISGMVTLLEQARIFGELAKTGWRPRRTLVFCAWDAEEPGLLGSTDWAEHHAETLREKAVAYINTDGNSRGFLSIGGSHSLERLAAEVARAVADPQTGVSVSERLRSALLVQGSDDEKKHARESADLHLRALGSGSDYTVFLQHLGIPSFNLSFRGEGEGGEYHTLFDTFDHYVRFHDPTFEYGLALTSVCGRLMLRLSEADVLPFEFTRAARTIGSYVDEVVKLADTMREKTEEWNRLVDEGHVARADDPTKKLSPAEKKKPVPNLNFAPLQNSSRRLKESAARCDAALAELAKEPDRLPIEHREQLEEILYRAEQALIHSAGLPRRPWFRHQVYAPGYYTGYGVKTLPGVREGIEERDWKETEERVGIAAAALERYAEEMERATELIERFGGED